MTDLYKYPRTFHVPWSREKDGDDKILHSMEHFVGKNVVVTEKRDGENSTIYSSGYFHARSLDGNVHPSQGWLKGNFAKWFYQLPGGWRVCGENLYATHAIEYSDLDTFFEVFSIWTEKNECLSWDEMELFCKEWGLKVVPVLYRGVYDEEKIKASYRPGSEGYVIRTEEGFHFNSFSENIAKYVRIGHVGADTENWRQRWDNTKVNSLKK
ncbi:MAG: RNA ligase family protein [Candidatus Pacearchaeota archaeon]